MGSLRRLFKEIERDEKRLFYHSMKLRRKISISGPIDADHA